jgi:hypothetical protein
MTAEIQHVEILMDVVNIRRIRHSRLDSKNPIGAIIDKVHSVSPKIKAIKRSHAEPLVVNSQKYG